MSFYLVKNEELIFVPYNLLAIDFEFITTKIIENKAKKYFQEIIEIGAVFKSENLCEKYSKIIKPRYFLIVKIKVKVSMVEDFLMQIYKMDWSLIKYLKI
nr:hypothetical protein [Clostridium botulinum]